VAVAELFCGGALAQDAGEILEKAGIQAGLGVHLGTTDGQLEAALARGGRLLVHGLALDEAALHKARRTLLERGLYGLASVELWHPQPKLPYAENLVNLLIADKAALAERKVGEAEVLRVLVPNGKAYLREGDAWRVVTKPWPKEMDHWTHFDYDCTNNAVSRDELVRPVTTLKWIEGYRGLRYSKAASGAFRSWNGTLVHEVKTVEAAGGKPRDLLYLAARDAFNGLPHWVLPIQSTSAGGLQSIVVADGMVFTMANPDKALGPMRAYDLKTGRELVRYDQAGLLETPQQAGGDGHAYGSGAPRWVRILYHDGRLFQSANDSLYCLDAKTGKRLWAYTDPDGLRLLFPTVAPDLGLICVASTEKAQGGRMANDWGEWNSRWPASKLVAITALRADTGQLAWRNTEVAGKTAGQLVYDRGCLAFFSPSGIGAMGNRRDVGLDWTWLGALDAKGGRLKWCRNYRREKLEAGADSLGFAFTLVLRDGKAYVTSQNHIVEFDAETGKALRHLAPPIPNARCTRPRSTAQYHLMGFGTFVHKDLATTVNQDICRSDCMTGPTPANGMVYHTPNGCTCFAMIRGFAGFGSEPLWPPLPVSERLLRGDPNPPQPLIAEPRPQPPAETFPASATGKQAVAGKRVPVFEGSLLRAAWINNDVLPYPETEAVAAGDLSLVAAVNEHRLEARQGNRIVWSFVAGGRIASAPLVHQGRACVGSHDGWVTCLDQKDGRVVWRFLAAPNHRKIVAYGQLESSWPVYGVVLHEGLIAVSAGRHPELDGGIYLYGLGPASGEAKWQGRLHVDAEAIVGSQPQGKPRNWRKPANTVVNPVLQVKEGKLVLVSTDMTNEGVSRPPRLYELVIDPRSPPN
jgi:outer membrane protein assembly factor BamB